LIGVVNKYPLSLNNFPFSQFRRIVLLSTLKNSAAFLEELKVLSSVDLSEE